MLYQNYFSLIIGYIVIVFVTNALSRKESVLKPVAFNASIYFRKESATLYNSNVINNSLSPGLQYEANFSDKTINKEYYSFHPSNIQPLIVGETVLFSNLPNDASTGYSSTTKLAKQMAHSRNTRSRIPASANRPDYVTPKPDKKALNPFAKAILYAPEIRKYLSLEIPGCEAAEQVYNILIKVLKLLQIPNAVDLAKAGAEAVLCYDNFNLAIFFQSMGNFFIKFLDDEGVEITPDLPERFAEIMVKSLLSTKVTSIRALFTAFAGGLVGFIESVGFNFVERVNDLSIYFNTELKALQRVCNC